MTSRLPFLLLVSSLALAREAAQDGATLTIAACEKDRRWVLAEAEVKVAPPYRVNDEKGALLPAQGEGRTVRWLVPFIPAGARSKFLVTSGAQKVPGLALEDGPSGSISVKGPDREITRYQPTAGVANKKPCFYPLMVSGVNLLRGYPLDERPGEAKDHPHQTGMFHAFGEVNGKDYWSKVPIAHRKILKKEAGPAFARIVAENAWGEDLVETQDVLILNAGADAVIDWTISLRAENGPVVFGKDQKQAKEGSFSLRLCAPLSQPRGDSADIIVDSKGHKGEKATRADAAPWVDYSGTVEGKKVGVSIMNHPGSFRYPTTWHVRAYGLFAANPWYMAEAKGLDRKGEHTLEKGQSLTLRYRVYAHAGDAAEGKVAEVFEGYSTAKVSGE